MKNKKSFKWAILAMVVGFIIFVPKTSYGAEFAQQKAFKVPTPCNKYVNLIEQYQGWDTSKMIKIMFLESGCSTVERGDGHLTYGKGKYGMSCGLLQVRILPNRGVTCEDMKDPAKNIAMAYKIYKEQGYKAWSVYKKI